MEKNRIYYTLAMFYTFVKRFLDIIIAILMLIIFLPFLPVFAIIIKHQSPGPVFFKQKRTGLNGKTFVMYKLRSMDVNDEADTKQATRYDSRKFPFGRFMRKLSIDEIPQLVNVLKGDMSIIGPRPHMLLHTKYYSALIPNYMERHKVKPGITGWAQVKGNRGSTPMLWIMERRVESDIWYVHHQSFLLDLTIMVLTFKVLLFPSKTAN